ncbi:efflux RND transporter periplasmic adaptor subunit [Paraflavitalea pollutisoli]|uniref:efflux RND transporter periplasmic adaptor subunit n=1 Tax=Paraflavitalea pollutisoli TaxID=3034143 RepID=UPI0023ED7A68|nr:efflux RND transporter periplasmic adaptor subunit [Paraflavitalea sp. H1-2-19X]
MMQRIITVLILASLLTQCKDEPAPADDPIATADSFQVQEDVVTLTAVQAGNAGIATGTPAKRSMHTSLQVSGIIDVPPQNIVSISVPLGGYLKKTALLPGTKISKGAVLATLEDQQYIQLQEDYLTAKSKLGFAEADFSRQQGLNATKAVSDKVFQQVRSEYESQKILVRSLAEKLRLIGINPASLNENTISRSIHLYAPISGYVSKVNVNIGKYVSPTDVLFELISPNDLHLSLTVFENHAANLRKGQPVVCYSNSNPGVKYQATVELITPAVNEERSAEVHCHFLQGSKDLMPGMFMNAEIEFNNAQVLSVPEDAVVKWSNAYYVFVEEAPNTFKLLPVETGVSHGGYTELKTALAEDKKLVTKNAYTLLMKMKNSAEE